METWPAAALIPYPASISTTPGAMPARLAKDAPWETIEQAVLPLSAKVPVGRVGTLEEIADAVSSRQSASRVHNRRQSEARRWNAAQHLE
jgi:hypothetical protein